MSDALKISRTTVRAILNRMSDEGIIRLQGREKTLLRAPVPGDRFAQNVVEPVSRIAEKRVMEWLVGPDCVVGALINALDLSRRLDLSVSAVRDCLARFEHFGIVTREESGRWRSLGLTADLVSELFEIREIQECRALERLMLLPDSHPAWAEIRRIGARHQLHLEDKKLLLREFTIYDSQLHLTIASVASNRFFIESHSLMGLIFPYHYDTDMEQNFGRQRQAVLEHLTYIDALMQRDLAAAKEACLAHLHSALATLLNSIEMKAGVLVFPQASRT
ncbi:GntR family transcriptional regulator [Xinfangfangia sp. D13-10-4-6]|nr:GntR family transcriptional regulator [Pseudogemmobacter hezensis]